MREGIGKYRGYCGKDGEWVYGNLIVEPDRVRIWTANDLRSSSCVEVDRETIGEFTGGKDKNGVDVYGGDKMAIEYTFVETVDVGIGVGLPIAGTSALDIQTVEWSDDLMGWVLAPSNEMLTEQVDDAEVIGNIHDTVDRAQKAIAKATE